MNSMLLPYFGRLARAKSPAVPKSLAPIKAAAVPAETVPVVPVTTRPAGATQTPRGWGADKTMPKQIIAKQKITTGFICKAQKTGFSHKKLRGLLKKERWSTYDADWIGSDDKCTVSPPLYIRFGNWHGEYLEQSTTKMMQNRNNNLVNAKTEMRWRGRTKDWKLEPNLDWNAWLNRSKYEIVVLRQTSLFILHYLMIGKVWWKCIADLG